MQRFLEWKVQSKVKGMKKLISGDWSIIQCNFSKKQATITRPHTQENNKQECSRKTNEGLLWCNEEFDTINLDPICLPLDALQDKIKQRATKVFWAWIETHKLEPVKGIGDPVIQQHFNMSTVVSLRIILILKKLSIAYISSKFCCHWERSKNEKQSQSLCMMKGIKWQQTY